ncbi:hypothetical protein CROQUDRAFT_656728 [Cronartium quercuum f. sp. fusiforme G11]|uniref:Uncharacterized protein n=1 Tax=Cronartium quercuum f. sp. fusiforme G11 TaxID=708437 RepID=A0A9P6TCR6_9BASI|nr:hypothetical protein CROQUDRAFT_656728 [Cronartium quercuum f. sp. fusiforme G11]
MGIHQSTPCCRPRSRGSMEKFKQSKKIDRQLKVSRKQMQKEVKLLLLGAGESGKTTVLKQMHLVHGLTGFSAARKEEFRQQVFKNLRDSMELALEIMRTEKIELEDESLLPSLALLDSFDYLEPGQPFPHCYHGLLTKLWADKGVQSALERRTGWAIPENIYYFYSQLEKLFDVSYSPTDQDILQCRGKSTGVTEYAFVVSDLNYRIVDVGGQRSERKKWINCFEDVTAILFLVAMSGYDIPLLEARDSNQIHEAFILFDTIINSKWFTCTSIILFLNKTDVLKQKLLYSPISQYLSDYKGKDHDYEAVLSYFKSKFSRLNQTSKEKIYTHYTCATDTSVMRVVMSSVTEIILTENVGISYL